MANRFEAEMLRESFGAQFVRELGTGWACQSLEEPSGRKPARALGGMASDEIATYFPQRADRRRQLDPDPLARKPFFACGEAARRGWALMIWENPYSRARHLARIREQLARREVLPLPG